MFFQYTPISETGSVCNIIISMVPAAAVIVWSLTLVEFSDLSQMKSHKSL